MRKKRFGTAGTGLEALGQAVPKAASLTVYMCWHGGRGHAYPREVVDAAGRLRNQHMPQVGSSEGYTALTFPACPQDVLDFTVVAPFCDLAYVSDDSGEVLAEASGQEEGTRHRRWPWWPRSASGSDADGGRSWNRSST